VARCSHVGVIIQDYARVIFQEIAGAQAALDFGAHGILLPSRKIGGFAYLAGLHVDDSEDADACAHEFSCGSMFGGELVDRVAHFIDGAVGALGGSGGDG
jgi:hypothetical protein